MKSVPTFDIEREINAKLIAGVDEAGRGPLCGPVVAAAVIFRSMTDKMPLITDSKQMTRAARQIAFDWITQNCIFGIGQCSPTEIDELNILHASMLAMKRAIAALPANPDFTLIDGNRLPKGIIPESSYPSVKGCPKGGAVGEYKNKLSYHPGVARHPSTGGELFGRAVVKGDSKSISIAAASIIAKETRDKIMCELSVKHPQYFWDKNAGYPTQQHLRAIKEFGINEHYRKSFKPVKDLL